MIPLNFGALLTEYFYKSFCDFPIFWRLIANYASDDNLFKCVRIICMNIQKICVRRNILTTKFELEAL